MKKLARFIKIIGDSNRLAIIKAIGSDARSVTEIINSTGLSQTLVSFHLRNLRGAGVVSTRRAGPFIYYNLTDLNIIDVLETLAAMAGLPDDLFNSNKLAKTLKIQAKAG